MRSDKKGVSPSSSVVVPNLSHHRRPKSTLSIVLIMTFLVFLFISQSPSFPGISSKGIFAEAGKMKLNKTEEQESVTQLFVCLCCCLNSLLTLWCVFVPFFSFLILRSNLQFVTSKRVLTSHQRLDPILPKILDSLSVNRLTLGCISCLDLYTKIVFST